MTGFQRAVNQQPAPAQAGDFASKNPFASVLAGDHQFIAAVGGLVVGVMAWANPATGLAANYFTEESLLGFVHRDQPAIITEYLAETVYSVQQGFPVTLMATGDFWGAFPGGASVGDKVYADPVTGALTADATGQGETLTGWTGAVTTAGVLTISGSGTGTIAIGQVVVGADIPDGSYIVSLGTGVGGTGTYNLNQGPASNVSAEAVTLYGVQETPWYVATPVPVDAEFTASINAAGVLNVSAVSAGALEVGQVVTGTDVPFNTVIQAFISGTGGTGTYQVTTRTAVSSTAMVGTAGQLAKITQWGQA